MAQIRHIPVLLAEVLEHLAVPSEGRILDLTLGLGGHAKAILGHCGPEARYLGVDRDPHARELAQANLGRDARLSVIAAPHEAVWEEPVFQAWMSLQAPDGVDAVLMDLGVSTLQLKDATRGFSFSEEGPLDMRMDTSHGPTALDWIAEQTDESLADALYLYGEERASRPIARAILAAFRSGSLLSTRDLAQAIYTVLPREIAKRKKQSDPATRSFQAIRIAVNGELEGLAATIEKAVAALKPGGRIGIISFHSLEDRIVKQTLRRLAGIYDGPGRVAPEPLPQVIRLIKAGGLAPSEAEVQANPASRSARLRVAERLSS